MIPYPAKGLHTVQATFVEQFFLTAGEATFENHVVAAGQTLEAGSVLGQITASSELVLSDTAAGDGSEVPMAILLENLDTTAAADEVSVLVFSTRTINFNALRAHPSWADKNALRAALRRAGLSTRTPIYSAL
jgi:hypothetical protein